MSRSSNVRRYKVEFSRAQLHYLRELVADDLEMTDLDMNERQQAEAILSRVDQRVEEIEAASAAQSV